MVTPQQLLVKAIIATMAFGGVACLCPTAADAQAAPPEAHAHHGYDTASRDDARHADCGEDCEAGCERASAVASEGAGSPSGKTVFQLDDAAMLPAAVFAFAPPPDEVVWSGTSPLRAPLLQETPVQRCDCLLD